MATLIAHAQFIDSATTLGKDGLTVTVDCERITRANGTRAALLTGEAATPVTRNGLYYYVLTGADLTTYDYVFGFTTTDTDVVQRDIAALWTLYAAQVADEVWDETLSAGAHATLFSAGKRLQNVVLRGGTAVGGGDNYIEFPGPWSAVDGIYEQNIVSIVDGLGVGQTRLIVEYVGADRRAYVDWDWAINPDATSEIELLPFSAPIMSDHGLAQAGTANSITLAATASAVDNIYVGSVIFISTGTGSRGQVRLITAYAGGTKIATVADAWTVTPNATSVYKIFPIGRTIVDSIGATATAQVNAEADTALADYDGPTNTEMEARTLAAAAYATAANQTTILARIGSFTGSGVNTILGFLKAVMSKAASTPSDVGGTFSASTDSTEALRDGLPAAVWTNSTRTLTQSAASVAATVSGDTITLSRGDTLSASITGLGSLSGYVSLDFTVKYTEDDTDAEAVIRIRKNASGSDDGLLRLNGADASSRSTNGSITIDDSDSGDITIALAAAESDDLVDGSYFYDIQEITSSAVSTLSAGTFVVAKDVTRLIS